MLRDADYIRDRTLLLTQTGSHAYGTNVEGSDVDVRGVYAPRLAEYVWDGPVKEVLSTQLLIHAAFADDVHVDLTGVDDLELLEARKFLDLAAGCNPNILDILFAAEENILLMDRRWRRAVYNKRHSFLTKRVFHTFRGYAKQQLKRLQNHRAWLLNPPAKAPERTDFGLGAVPEVPHNQFEALRAKARTVLGRWEVKYPDTTPRSVILDIQEQMDDIVTEILGASEGVALWGAAYAALGVDSNFIDLLKKEHAFEQAVSHYASYMAWKAGRNERRAALEAKCGYDAKHAMHCVRLLLAARDILRTGDYCVKSPYREELLKIRTGEVPFEVVMARVEELNREATSAYDATKLPEFPPEGLTQRMLERIIIG